MSPFMSWFAPIFALSFVSAHLAMMAGLLMERRRGKKSLGSLSTQAASVSIVIPARNEQANLAALFASLRAQEYAGVLEVVLIDDRSSDHTLRMFQEFQASAAFPVKILHLDENPGPNFKQKALEHGIELASGKYLLFTDADCMMAPGWVTTMAALLGDEKTAL
ncbi:MAG: glycosyltransferase family A protein, partial [Spirochaetota bacterium]